MEFFEKVGGITPVGHYSFAVKLDNGLLYLSGQISIDEAGNLVGSTVAEQARNILKNVEKVLLEAGYSTRDVFKVVVYITDMSKFSEFNEVYKEFFGEHKPVRTTVGVRELPRGALVEIEAYAYK
ncbi:MAG: RidA family protein [Brevinematia bacterium]